MESLLSFSGSYSLTLTTFQSLLLAALAVAKLLSMATKIAILIVPALQGKLHSFPRALDLNYNPILLPSTWHILGAKMGENEDVTEPPAECKSWTCMLKYRSQPYDVMNVWTCDGDSDLIASFTRTYIKLNNCCVTSGGDSWGPAQGTTVNNWMEWEKSTKEFIHTRCQHHHRVSSISSKPGDEQRLHCCHEVYLPPGVKTNGDEKKSGWTWSGNEVFNVKGKMSLCSIWFFVFIYLFFLVDSWQMMYDQYKHLIVFVCGFNTKEWTFQCCPADIHLCIHFLQLWHIVILNWPPIQMSIYYLWTLISFALLVPLLLCIIVPLEEWVWFRGWINAKLHPCSCAAGTQMLWFGLI